MTSSSKGPRTVSVLPQGSNEEVRKSSKAFALSAAILLAVSPLAACGDNTTGNPSSSSSSDWDSSNQSAEDKNGSRLVRGRVECIKELVRQGKTNDEAESVCDKAFADAMAQAAARGENTSQYNSSNNGGGSNALLWYMIGRSHAPAVYEAPSSSSGSYRYMGGTSTPGFTPAPAYSAAQGSYLSQAPAARTAAAASARASAAAARAQSPSTGATSRGGFSGGRSPSAG
jgi:hypothetical protein